jgi:hypothetical protein
VRHDTLTIAERCEAELGEEQWGFIEGCPRDWGNLPIPDGPITVGIDGGYVRDWEAVYRNFKRYFATTAARRYVLRVSSPSLDQFFTCTLNK